MRHIPEDELHAYLDQGLSRSQCVEIERHLAGCSSCRNLRDGIAALRDRTTALLAELAPPRGFPPAFETIRSQAAQRVTSHRRRVRAVAWAASLVAAVGLGWSASTMLRSDADLDDRGRPCAVGRRCGSRRGHGAPSPGRRHRHAGVLVACLTGAGPFAGPSRHSGRRGT